MSAKNRADLIGKLHKVAKKEYDMVKPPSDRTVLEHMIYGCCLEDSTYEAADEAFAKLMENYLDWNEVRVTTSAELAEVISCLSTPHDAAIRVRKSLHGVFEAYYQFDLDFLRRENLGKAVGEMSNFSGMSPFVVAYTAQNGLGGHSIPIDKSLMNLMYVIGAIGEEELLERKISGLERTIPKASGLEFAVTTHQLAVAFTQSPFSTNIRNLITKIAPDAKERFPKRSSGKTAEKSSSTEKSSSKKPVSKKEPAAKAVTKKAPATSKKSTTTKSSSSKAGKKKPR